jgi:hypothetical protein
MADDLGPILARLAALETTVGDRLAALEATIGHNGGPPLDDDDGELDQRLPTRRVAARYGISVRTLERWALDPVLKFPKSDVVNKRKYWYLRVLRRYDRERAAMQAKIGPRPKQRGAEDQHT